jgi:hypothetical protein
MKQADLSYCYEKCEKGSVFAKKSIWDCESVFDAAFDFQCFVDECFKTCPYKDCHKKVTHDEDK